MKKNINLKHLPKENKIAIRKNWIKFDRKKIMKDEIVKKKNDRDNQVERKWKKKDTEINFQ
jgi:hypothetical protein